MIVRRKGTSSMGSQSSPATTRNSSQVLGGESRMTARPSAPVSLKCQGISLTENIFSTRWAMVPPDVSG